MLYFKPVEVERMNSLGIALKSIRANLVPMPVLLADFCVWIPVQFAVYMFPLPLQIQLVGFAGFFWSLVGLAAGIRIARSRSVCATRAS